MGIASEWLGEESEKAGFVLGKSTFGSEAVRGSLDLPSTQGPRNQLIAWIVGVQAFAHI